MNKKTKPNYLKASPLPFQGQKKHLVNQFVSLLEEVEQQGKITTIVDLFGGSGLLSHISKRVLPHCDVIYNDYDNFSKRLKNIPRTNELLDQFRMVVPDDIKNEARLDLEIKNKLLEIIKQADNIGYVDYITISSALIFSSRYATSYEDLERSVMYNRIKYSNYNETSSYLDGLEITHCDYMELFERYKDRDDVLFLVDPPYLFTDTKSYNSGKYWTLTNYLDVLVTLNGINYVFFTSDKSQLVELCQWINRYKAKFDTLFFQEKTTTQTSFINHNSKSTDIMLWRL